MFKLFNNKNMDKHMKKYIRKNKSRFKNMSCLEIGNDVHEEMERKLQTK